MVYIVMGNQIFCVKEKSSLSFRIAISLYEITIVKISFNKDPNSPENPLITPIVMVANNNKKMYRSS